MHYNGDKDKDLKDSNTKLVVGIIIHPYMFSGSPSFRLNYNNNCNKGIAM